MIDNYTDYLSINLSVLSSLRENEKLTIINDNYLQIDKTANYLQPLFRFFKGDNRERIIECINKLVESSIKHAVQLKDPERCEFVKNIQASLKGIVKLTDTYSGDEHNMARLRVIENNIKYFIGCDNMQ
jgi:hypothetical protein